MKNIFTLLLATVSVSAFAYDGGKLTITVPSSKNIQIYVDGRIYQNNNNNTIVLNNIKSGNHTTTIYKNNRNGNGYGNNGRDNRRNNNNRYDQRDVLYNSNVYVRPSYHVDVMINRFGKALVDERAINNNYENDDDDWYDNGYGNGGYNNDGYNNDDRQAMSDYEFNQVLQKIRNQWIGKLSTARDEMNNHYFTTSQVRQVLQLFSSENDKLELAKLSYKNVVDRQNFRQLYDLFSSRSQEELTRYTRDFRY
jgi:hypothetical protein